MCEEVLSASTKGRDHPVGVGGVAPGLFALEEEFEFWGEIGNPRFGPEHHFLPGPDQCRVSSIGPTVVVSFADGGVELPGASRGSAYPHIILVRPGRQSLPVPSPKLSRRSPRTVPSPRARSTRQEAGNGRHSHPCRRVAANSHRHEARERARPLSTSGTAPRERGRQPRQPTPPPIVPYRRLPRLGHATGAFDVHVSSAERHIA